MMCYVQAQATVSNGVHGQALVPDRLSSPSPVRESSLGCEAGPSYEEAMAAMNAEPLDCYESSDEVRLQSALSHGRKSFLPAANGAAWEGSYLIISRGL